MLRLNPFDDYPFHQHIAPTDIPATSDPHFNDGYWWAWYARGSYFFCGLRVHPNNNVMDGYAGAVHDGVQRNIRVSRVLRPGANELRVGPLRIDIAEPLVRQHLVLGPNDSGVEFDVVTSASCPPYVETPAIHYRHGRVLNHLIRYSGPTRVTGSSSVDGAGLDVRGWHGARDHSWGIRSTMGPHVPIRGAGDDADDADRRAMRLWVPFEAGSRVGFFHLHEDRTGRVLDFEGQLRRGDGSAIPLASVRHALEYHHGTRRLAGGAFSLVLHDGSTERYTFRVACPPAHPQGFGYTRGWSDGGNPGVYRDTFYQEADRFSVADPAGLAGPAHVPASRRLGGTEFAADLTAPSGETGMAHVEHMIYGAYEPYGFGEK